MLSGFDIPKTNGARSKNEWAPVHESIAGPDIFVLGEGFLVDTSMVLGSGSAWPWRSSLADMFELLKAQ